MIQKRPNPLTARITNDLRADLKKAAAALGISVNRFVVIAIEREIALVRDSLGLEDTCSNEPL